MTPRTLPSQRRDDVDVDTVLEAFADAGCRSILQAADEPRLAKELSEACDLPSSTVYRKIDQMSEAGLLKEQTRIDRSGHHASEYVSTVESVTLVADGDGGLDLEVDWKDDLGTEREGYASFAPADD